MIHFKKWYLYFFILFPSIIYAYPQFVGHGYNSCLTCHYNPFGNGPLNDYGRAIGAVAVSSRSFYSNTTTDENIAANAGFFGSKKISKWIRPAFDYRGMGYFRGLKTDQSEKEFIQMQADANLVIKNSDNSFFLSGTLGYAPTPRALKNLNTKVDKLRSREHYLGYRPHPSFGIYLGLMDKIYGVRVAEHSSFARSINNLSQNDQSYGAQLHFAKNKYEVGAGYFIGQFNQEDQINQKGFSFKFDYKNSSMSSLGFSYLSSSSSFVQQTSASLHYIGSIGSGSSILLEAGKTTFTPTQGDNAQNHTYFLGQTYLKFTRGLYLFNQIEILEEKDGSTNLRFGPGFQYFPLQRIELRFEIYNTRNFSSEISSNDTWDLLAQVHIWL